MSKNTTFTIGLFVAMTCSAFSPDAVAQTRTPPQQATPRAAAPQPATTPQPAAPPRPATTAAEDGAAVKGGEVVAQVGGSDVTAEELRAVVASLDARSQAAVARDPALLGQTVRAILANRLVLKEALSKKWDQQPAIVTQLARARDNLIIESYLNSVSVPPRTTRARPISRASTTPMPAHFWSPGVFNWLRSLSPWQRTPTRRPRIPRARSSTTS